ncbi:hypothetical protein [Bradyrhizobium sp. SZCCHNR1093]|uniref:hypothetical protein n=1 Tax=Bradyrhizobium sp. SZCCHNR1093 TaxID=3057368 RepID=UPI0028E48CD8|nr:hypothetical protein [Bradyrhizobium sp. SZCCHNR1093]
MRKPVELPPDVARAFVQRMNDYFGEVDATKRDIIAVLALRELEDHWPGRVRLNDIKALFHEMRGEAERSG